MNQRREATTIIPAGAPVSRPVFRAESGLRLLLPALILAALSLGSAGCAKRRADAAPIAPPVAISASPPTVERPAGPLSEPQTRTELPPPQAVPEGAAPALRGPFAFEIPESPEEPLEPEPERPPSTAASVASNQSAPQAPPSETAAPAQVPQLGTLMSDQQRRVFQREIIRNIDQARAALAILMGRRLTADQAEGVRRIREFLRQVDESRGTDTALARNLSERARLLADDLVRNTR